MKENQGCGRIQVYQTMIRRKKVKETAIDDRGRTKQCATAVNNIY